MNELVIHYTEEPTLFFFNGTTPSTIDIAITKDIPDVDNIKKFGPHTIQRQMVKYFDYKTTNWKMTYWISTVESTIT